MKVGGGTPYLPCNAKPYETRGKNFCPKVKVRIFEKMLTISQSFDVILCQSYTFIKYFIVNKNHYNCTSA